MELSSQEIFWLNFDKKRNLGWFLLIKFVDVIRENHPKTFLLIMPILVIFK